MAVQVDIFNPQISVVATGLEGKSIMIYGGNNVGKTYVAARLSKPFFIACENGLNAQNGVKYNRVTKWSDFKRIIKQFTSPATVDKARELYDTIVIDEVYASSIMCQDFVIDTYGKGALTLQGTGEKNADNLYQIYEKEYFREINLLLSCDYTVVFIGHAQEKDKFISPKGDKRCLSPILDNCDFVFYVESNGVDEDGKIIKSSAYSALTNSFFARSRFEYCPPKIEVFSAENLTNTIRQAVIEQEKHDGVKAVDYKVQKEQNKVVELSYDDVMSDIQEIGVRFAESDNIDILTEIVEETLGAGKKVTECTKKQLDVMTIILDNLNDKAKELGI